MSKKQIQYNQVIQYNHKQIQSVNILTLYLQISEYTISEYTYILTKKRHVFVMQPVIRLKSFLLMSAQAKLLEKNFVYLSFFS